MEDETNVPELATSEIVRDKVREHIANGGTAMCGMLVPVGARVLILYKDEVTAQEVGTGEILPLDANALLAVFMCAIGYVCGHGIFNEPDH